MVWVEEIYTGFVNVDPFCAVLFGELVVDSISQGYFKGLKSSVKSCARSGVPDVKAHGILVIFVRLRKVFGQSNRREGSFQLSQIFPAQKKGLLSFFISFIFYS